MKFTSESVMHDIEVALKERKEIEWSNTDRLLLKAQLHIASLHRQLHNKAELTDEEIAKVVHELNQKANTPERWVTAMQIGAETIIHLRDELRKAQEADKIKSLGTVNIGGVHFKNGKEVK